MTKKSNMSQSQTSKEMDLYNKQGQIVYIGYNKLIKDSIEFFSNPKVL